MIKFQDYLDCDVEIKDVKARDKETYYHVKKLTCRKYVKEYFGGWNENEQREYNNKIFDESLKQDCFKIIKVKNKPVGFFGYSIFDREIGCVTLQIERNKKYLEKIKLLFPDCYICNIDGKVIVV